MSILPFRLDQQLRSIWSIEKSYYLKRVSKGLVDRSKRTRRNERANEGKRWKRGKKGVARITRKIWFANRVTFSSSNSRILWMDPPMAFFIKLILTDGRQSCATNSNSSQKLRLTVPCDRRRYREIYILSSHAERSFSSHVGPLVLAFTSINLRSCREVDGSYDWNDWNWRLCCLFGNGWFFRCRRLDW